MSRLRHVCRCRLPSGTRAFRVTQATRWPASARQVYWDAAGTHPRTNRVGVIGGGLGRPRGGLRAGRPRLRGHAVREELLASAARRPCWNGDGFRFDMGPTILTIPSVLRAFLPRPGRRLEDYLDLIRLDPQWRCFFADGTFARSGRRRERDGDCSRRLFARQRVAAKGYPRLPRHIELPAPQISDRHFFWKSIGGISRHDRLAGGLLARSSSATF